MTTYTLSGGCFWCLDAVYREFQGVQDIVSGYAGGQKDDANYYTVASGTTEHVETAQITFDETILPGNVVLDIFFTLHDPTSRNKQGADEGPQYASVMWYTDEDQKQAFETALQRAAALYDKPIVTRIEPLVEFYPGETEHQDYMTNNPTNPYCQIVIAPKVTKARHSFSAYRKD